MAERSDSQSSARTDIFSDEFALEPLTIADGFSSSSAHNESDANSEAIVSPVEQSQGPLSPDGHSGPFNSGQKATVPEKEVHDQISRNPRQWPRRSSHVPNRSLSAASDTSTPTDIFRSLSVASSSVIPRAQSPYQGAAGPSHPYGMYPQDIGMTRTPSVATTSATSRAQERDLAHLSAAQHPYGLYPGSTFSEIEEPANVLSRIPVGFPGHGGRQNDHRAFVPDGEDTADIVGPDGHTEQLPPYSRYPEEPGFKPLSPENSMSTQDFAVPVPATTNPRYSQVVPPTANALEEANAGQHLSAPLPDDGGSGSFKERWKEKGNKRVCCGKIPRWMICVLIISISFGGIVGGIAGGVLSHERKDDRRPTPAA